MIQSWASTWTAPLEHVVSYDARRFKIPDTYVGSAQASSLILLREPSAFDNFTGPILTTAILKLVTLF